MTDKMTSLQRVFTTLGHKEPDRVPLFLFPELHGSKELGLSIKEYFSRAEYVVEGQLRLIKKYKHDCVTGFFYAPLEIEAMGGEVVFAEDGPANSGNPLIKDLKMIKDLELPKVQDSPRLKEMLKATSMLKEKAGEEYPVIGVIISPFSLPVMQMGFDKYFDLMYQHKDLFELLMKKNMDFSVDWANAQLEAGATAIVYFDPVSSTTIIPRKLFMETGYNIARETFSKLKGPTAYHFASGRSMEILDDVIDLGSLVVCVSTLEDLAKIKEKCRNKITVLGNMDAIKMRRWDKQKAEEVVKNLIAKAASGGGYILADNHGEIPYMVDEDILLAISQAVHRWGRYPLNWLEEYNARVPVDSMQQL